jgi:hypothetical protein
MRIPVSLLLIFLLSFCWLSCNSKEQKEKPTITKNSSGDTAAITKAETTVNPYRGVDVSPADISYYPADYPKLKMDKTVTNPPLARVVYSRPHLQGRQLFPEVLKYNEYWRLGANEATELDLYHDATIQNKKIKAGRYVVYCVPQSDKWTIVLNTNIDSWGLHADSTKDIAKFSIPIKQTNNHLEYFTIIFEKTDGGADMLMAWDNIEARLPINF